MAAYFRESIETFISCSPTEIIGALHEQYAADGFASQYTKQTEAWAEIIPPLQSQLRSLTNLRPEAGSWTILLEYPLYRLRRRIDLVVLAGSTIVVVESKVGSRTFAAEDRRQVEEYALDLRDFHAASDQRRIVPVLWCTEAEDSETTFQGTCFADKFVAPLVRIGARGIGQFLQDLSLQDHAIPIVAEDWDQSSYRPVPSVIEAASIIFSGHDVRSIANADADNLRSASARLVELIQEARDNRKRYLLLLSGVPGSGKTLAGLHVVHSTIADNAEASGDIVYLSGNTPLVVVLREALARDEFRRNKARKARTSLKDIRRGVRARIQHINDFLHQSLKAVEFEPPHEHVIVFDEAQRAWDEKQGLEKFKRADSEPFLLLDLMSRHPDWCVCICLIGGGQEINSGEEGVLGWGQALRKIPMSLRKEWSVVGPPDVFDGGRSTGSFVLGSLPTEIETRVDSSLQLNVSQRSYRSPAVSEWVNHVLRGDEQAALATSRRLGDYPIVLVRFLAEAKKWLRENNGGERRFGLVASSGARRLRADGVGQMLHAGAGDEIAHWYLNPPGDIRSSFALEVPANEYTCQGLELDLACVCWGGDLLWNAAKSAWTFRKLSGTNWQKIENSNTRRYLENSYRVLLTRAREGMIVWVPKGDDSDVTRSPSSLDETAGFLLRCGAGAAGA